MSMYSLLKLDRLKFRQQLVLIFVVGLLLLTPATSFVIGRISNNILLKQLLAQGQQITATLVQHSKLALLYESDFAARESVKFVSGFPDITVLEIRSSNGNVLFDNTSTIPEHFKPDYAAADQLQNYEFEDQWIFISPVMSESDIDDSLAIDLDDASGAQTLLGYVTVSMSKQTLHLLQTKAYQTNFILTFVIAIAIVFVLVRISRSMTTPIEKLALHMKQAEGGDTGVRSEVRGQPDVTVMQHAFNTMMDELERRESDLTLARDRALEAARVKGEFAANVTHELRTPMNAVLGMMDLLAESQLSSRQVEYVNIARSSGESLLSLIEDILDFSKNDAGNLVTTTAEVNLAELVEDIIRLLASQALGKGIDIGYFLDRDIPSTLILDRSRLQQVLINLLGNAIKFTETGEVSVTISLRHTLSDAESNAESDQLLFAVKDTGIGITEADQDKIFEPFTQADASTTRQYAGTGLGLTISKQIVTLMGGEIGLTSELGKGSTFWFALPYQGLATSQSIPSPTTTRNQTTKVLLIARSKIIQEFSSQIFLTKMVSCNRANNYLDAASEINRLNNNEDRFDFIVIDQDSYFLHEAEFKSIFSSRVDTRLTSIVILVNPFRPSKISHAPFQTIEKPLIGSSYNAVLHTDKERRALVSSVHHNQVNSIIADNPRILVVDDNRINQQVAKEMLNKLGCKAEIASNGKQALEMILKAKYDLVLMDCNMPVMDGYESTVEIRRLEGFARMPIIAMTANVTDAEKDQCIAAGMDSFLGKPLRLGKLKDELYRWLPESSISRTADISSASSTGGDTAGNFDAQVIKELFESVGDVAYRMIEAFIEDTPVYIDSMKAAVAADNSKQVRDLAHTLKGSAANFGAHPFIATTKTLEELAQHGQLGQCDLYISTLIKQFAALREDFETNILKTNEDDSDPLQSLHSLLLVDDDRTIRLALKEVFKSRKFEILEASDGRQAINICKRKIPDIILMDAIMPETDGFTACSTIRSLPNCADVPILMVTSLDDEDAILKAFASGATDYITKPLHFTVLQERVVRLIQADKVSKKVKEMAYYDTLTGLPNRARLMQELRVILNRSSLDNKRIAVLFLDLDHFKNINDSLGHNVGDLLLKVVADRLRGCLRETDFIARLGGDEFTVVLEDVDSNDTISRISKTICDALNEPFVFLQQKMFVSASIGISVFPEDAGDVNTLLKHADLAMFKAKKSRNHFSFYQAGMEDQISRRLEVEQELRYAIEHNQLVLHIQPQKDTTSGKIVAGEALVRWQHPRQGLLGPDHFIGIAEESGLITDLTRWVIRTAVKQISLWEKQGYSIKLSVNLSGRDLEATSHLVRHLTDVAQLHRLNTSLLELEITESILMGDPQKSREELLRLKEMGFTLAIDDFGTGYSSLNYLKNLPVDVLKIDRVFIKDIEENSDDRAIVKGIIALADSLGLQTVAEGVETIEQQNIVSELGCHVIQGYLINRPVTIEVFEESYKGDFPLKTRPPGAEVV